MKGAIVVLNKELREMARDKRVLLGAVIMPIFVIALFVFLIGYVSQQISSGDVIKIALVQSGNSFPLDLPDELSKSTIFVDSEEIAKKLIKDKTVHLALNHQININNGQATIKVYFDQKSVLSAQAVAQIKTQIDHANLNEVKKVLIANNLSEASAERLLFESEDVSSKEGLAGSSILSMLPYLIVLWAFYGGMSLVSDLVAGEKERGTMETLLISPIRRAEVALGKTFALCIVCFLSGLTTLFGIILIGSLQMPMIKALFPTGLAISIPSALLLLVILLSLAAFFSTMMVSLSAYAKNIRESHTFLTLLSFVVLLPAVFSQFIGFTGSERATWVTWTPILNSAVILKDLFENTIKADMVIIAVLLNLALAFLFLFRSFHLFRKEEILTRV